MTLTPGSRVGAYEILSALGAGGMGEVYRARDTKLHRDVAIKVLPDAFAADRDRLDRFEREARVLASLNHPNIAGIHGLEEAGSIRGLILELVEGPTLADVIARGPMALDDALTTARQVADALEAAHELGIIHRDLKPANVKVRPDGTVKVLDFGLAKALAPDVASAAADAANSPTLTAHGTQLGMILGTAAYMAPEQARGKPVDKRADIWAFGVVLYEMLTGRRAFKGDDVTETLAAVLKDRPPLDALPASTPVRLKRLLERCLERDPKERLRDIGEARVEIARIMAGAPEISPASEPAASGQRPLGGRLGLWLLAATLGVALIALLLVWAPWRDVDTQPPRTLLANIGVDASLATGSSSSAVLSPDGQTLAFVARTSPTAATQLFVRRLDQLNAVALAGTENAVNPFFKPDGQWIGFFGGGKLRKVSVDGGAVVDVCEIPGNGGGTWIEDGTIIFSIFSQVRGSLMRVKETGGTPAVFGEASSGAWPHALPAGRGVLYTVVRGRENSDVMVAPLSGSTPKVAVPGAYFALYVPAASDRSRDDGHLIYVKDSTLFAVRFDLDRLEPIGEPVPALEGVRTSLNARTAQVSISSDGTLLYVPGATEATANAIDWMTSDGKTSVLRTTKADWVNPRFSPDGNKLALEIFDGTQRDIWVYEIARGEPPTQVTFDAADDLTPVWTVDGKRIVFSSDRAKAGVLNMYWVTADGAGNATRLIESAESQVAYSWHRTGNFLAFQANRGGVSEVWILPMKGDGTAGEPYVLSELSRPKMNPMFSPDGRWIAYNTPGPSGFVVEVLPFGGSGGPWRVPTEFGLRPRWSASELFFLNSNERKVMAAPYTVAGDAFRVGSPRVWSPASYVRGRGINRVLYDLHPDGKRVAIAVARDNIEAAENQLVFVFNFSNYLNRIAPASN